MSASKLADFAYENTKQGSDSYLSGGIEYTPISDSNSNVYSNGVLNWSNLSIMGAGQDANGKMYLLGDSYVAIPIEYSATIAGGTWRLDGVAAPVNKYAVSKKSNLAFVESLYTRLGGANLSSQSDFRNLYNTQLALQNNMQQQKLNEQSEDLFWDSPEGMRFSTAIGEVNCQSLKNGNFNTTPDMGYNKAIWERNKHFLDVTNYTDPLDATMTNPYYSLTNGVNTMTNSMQPYFSQTSTTVLTWRDMVLLPLSRLHDVFKQMPPIANLQGFELRLHTNLAAQNNWKITFADIGNTAVGNQGGAALIMFQPASMVANQNQGNCCPFLLAQPTNEDSNASGSACVFTQSAAGTACSVTVTGQIGWSGVVWPAKLYLATAAYTPAAVERIYKNPSFRLLYNDIYMDYVSLNVPTNTLFQRNIQTPFSKLRRMWIIPSLAAQSNGTSQVAPYRSLMSSFGNTSSVCKLRQFAISIGSTPLFSMEPLQYPWQFFDFNYKEAMSITNGNSLNSLFTSGQVGKTDWVKAFGAYCFDMQRVFSEPEDNVPKSLSIQFNIDGRAGTFYDFFIIVEEEKEVIFDRLTCAVSNA
jgi:hypothetical protein